MVRRIKLSRQKTAGSQMSLADFVAPDAPKKKPSAMSKQRFEELLVKTNEMKEAQQWEVFEPKHFVALYCLLHHHVYGVMPNEVRQHYAMASRKAGDMLEQEFGGERKRMVDFMRWVWSREINRNKKRDQDNDFRIGWRLQFAPTYVSDYRVARARKGKKIQ